MKSQEKTQTIAKEQAKEAHRRLAALHGPISFKKYKRRRMTPVQWLRLDFEYKQGLIPAECVPLPLNWRVAIPESLWWLPRAEKDGWSLDAMDQPTIRRALNWDYTSQLYETIYDFATGGDVTRHEGGNMIIVIEGLQRTGKSDLAKTAAKLWVTIQYDLKGRYMSRKTKSGESKLGVRPKAHVVLGNKELNEAIRKMSDMDILVCDELDKWTGLASTNRAEGYANLMARIAKTGKSFIFVSPEVRIPIIKQLAYITFTTFGICYAFEATRFIVSKKSRFTNQYKLMGVAALQRNWRFAEFRKYHEKKAATMKSSEKTMGLATGFNREEVERDRETLWEKVFNEIFDSDDELFYYYSISMADWRDYAGHFKDEDGDPIIDIEGLGDGYAKYVAKGLSTRHKVNRTRHTLDKRRGRAIGKYAQEVSVDVLPRSIRTIEVEMRDGEGDKKEYRVDFVPSINLPLDERYIENMYQQSRLAIQEKWGQDSVWGKKLDGKAMLKKINDLNDKLLSWRLQAILQSTRKTARELTKEGFRRSHMKVSKDYNAVQATIAGIMDELAFDGMHPHLRRIGGEREKGLRDLVYDDENGKMLATISKKCRTDKAWRPQFKDLSEREGEDVIAGKPVFLVCTELETQRMVYWTVKLITTDNHNAVLELWNALAQTIFVDMLKPEEEDEKTSAAPAS